MITEYSPPAQIVKEFGQDMEKAQYWFNKNRSMSEVADCIDAAMRKREGELVSGQEVMYYSKQTQNHWMIWNTYRSRGCGVMPAVSRNYVCYQLQEKYMSMMTTGFIINEDNEEMTLISIYTNHLFMRLASRLGLDMTDRLKTIRNFKEVASTCLVDFRKPRKGENWQQAVCRMPGSWLRGHVIHNDGKRCMIIFRTFYTDNSLTPFQRKYLSKFKSFADSVKSEHDFIRKFHE